MVLFQVFLVALAVVQLTEAAPQKQKVPSTDELKQTIQSLIAEWKPEDYIEQTRQEIRQRMKSLAEEMDATAHSLPSESEMKEFFDGTRAAASEKIQDLLDSVMEVLEDMSSAPEGEDPARVKDFIDIVEKDVQERIDKFVQEIEENLHDIAEFFSQVSEEDIEKTIREIREDAEKKINEWKEEIQKLFDNSDDEAPSVAEIIRAFTNQKMSKDIAEDIRLELLKRFQDLMKEMKSNPTAVEFLFDLPNATEWEKFFEETRREIKQEWEEFVDNVNETLEDLRRFNFSEIGVEIEDFISDLVDEAKEGYDRFLRDVQEALEKIPAFLRPPSKEEITKFINDTFQETRKQVEKRIDEIEGFLEDLFGDGEDTIPEVDTLRIKSYQGDLFNDTGIYMAAPDGSLSLAAGGSGDGGESGSSSGGTTAIVLICVGVVCGTVVAGVVVRRKMRGRKKMYKHVESPSAAKLQEASLKAMAHSSHEYGTYE